MQPYYTIEIPYVDPRFATEWHPTTSEGPFSTLTRGNFKSQNAAIEWAKAKLNGTPYTVKLIEA